MGDSYSKICHLKIKVHLLLGFFFIFCFDIYCQNQRLADSLEIIYSNENFEEQNRLKILEAIAVNHLDPERKLNFSEQLIKRAQSLDSIEYLLSGLLQKGNALREKGDLSQALKSYFQVAKVANEDKLNRLQLLGITNITIADVYSDMNNHNNAINYYQKAIEILRKESDSLNLGIALYNTGDEYFNIKKYDKAILFFEESSLIFRNINNLVYNAFNLGSIGMIYADQGKYVLAKQNINQAIEILEEEKYYSPISEYLTYMSDIYANQNDLTRAFSYSQRSLELAQKYGLKKQISNANLKLSKLNGQAGKTTESFKYYKDYIVYRDSVNNLETVQEIADLRTNFEVQKKQDEIIFLEKEAEITELRSKKQKNMTYASAITSVLILLLSFTLFRRYNYIKKTSFIIQQETIKSEKLLLNILPEETALELKLNGKVQAKQFDSVSVMFTDFKDFTKYSLNLTPEVIVKSVDFYFSKFDEIIEKYGLEKIKTIGDAYMCAGGLPFPNKNHSNQILKAAFEISKFVADSKNRRGQDVAHFDVRIGINTGPVVAGVVGVKKFAYDIWGDTVNVASRMESMSTPGRINVSENTYKLIKDTFDCEYRGEIEVKNKGLMKMYFVNGIKT